MKLHVHSVITSLLSLPTSISKTVLPNLPGGTCAFLMFSSDYNVLCSKVIALNNFIQYSQV